MAHLEGYVTLPPAGLVHSRCSGKTTEEVPRPGDRGSLKAC